MNKYNELKEKYYSNHIDFYVSLVGSIIMGIIHVISLLIHFDSIVLCYAIFCFLMALIKIWETSIEKHKIKPNEYVAGVISMLLLITPMMFSFVMTILYKEAPHYIFSWLIYAYALYATIKMVFAIRKIIQKDKTNKEYVLSLFSLIGALYTIQLMEFALIVTFSVDGVKMSMFMMQLFTQGAIFLVSIAVIILFIIKAIKHKNKTIS